MQFFFYFHFEIAEIRFYAGKEDQYLKTFFPPKIFWLSKSINKQQYSTHESSTVCETHEEEKQHRDERRVDGPLHQQGHTGKIRSR